LNAVGLEVEGIEDPAQKLKGFRVAKILTAAQHPNADKLQVLTVDTGEGDPLQVVCGAPNARAGLVGVLGLPGAVVPANGMVLKVAAVRGTESNGMMCSMRELELGEGHDGIIELPEDAPVGTAFADYHGADPVFDIAITPTARIAWASMASRAIWRRWVWARSSPSRRPASRAAILARWRSPRRMPKPARPSMAASSRA
jgi:phenylalanyl-tRNA synthetase beta chain